MAVLNQRVDSWRWGWGFVLSLSFLCSQKDGNDEEVWGHITEKTEAYFFSRAFEYFIVSRRMSGPMLVGFLALSQLNLSMILRSILYPHFTDEETEAPRG